MGPSLVPKHVIRVTLSLKPLPALLGLPTEASDFNVSTLALLGELDGSSAAFLNFACDGLLAFASCTLSCRSTRINNAGNHDYDYITSAKTMQGCNMQVCASNTVLDSAGM